MSYRRKRRPIGIPTSSMADIAFLLLIFFILCSTFTKDTGIKLEQPRALTLDKLESSSVMVIIDDQQRIFLNGQEVDAAQAVEWGVLALLDGRDDPMQRIVQFKCDANTPKTVFEPVIEAIAKAGARIAALADEGQPVKRE